MDVEELRRAFPTCTDIDILDVPSGQKDVARATFSGGRVVLKLFRKARGHEARVERELSAVQKLRSKYVPEILEVGRRVIGGEDRYFIIEQCIDGPSYAQVLEDRRVQQLTDVLELGKSLLQACADFESVDLVHRDLKPANLIVGPEGKIWIIDFGFVRHMDRSRITPSGWAVGTLGYAPLEQLGLVRAEVNGRADLFSTGVIMYEALHGANPWMENVQEAQDVLQRMRVRELAPLAIEQDAGGGLAEFIGWLTQRYASRRPQTADDALRAYLPIYEDLRPAAT